MRPVIINGTVLCGDQLTGIPRYVYEVIAHLDPLLEGSGMDVRVLYNQKRGKPNLPPLKNITVVPLNGGKLPYNTVVQPRYVRRQKGLLVGLASDVILNRGSLVCLHDIRPWVMRGDKASFRFKFAVHCITIKLFAGHVVTVSENQRQLIHRALHIPLDKLSVIYNAWDHMKNVQPDETIFNKLPKVKRGGYYYILGSMAPHKNYQWVREVARRNPQEIFVVAGGQDLYAWNRDENAVTGGNICYPGYVRDGESRALMMHCKAFLQPSKFEGFGIPPLEALSAGAKILCSNATCLPEIYGDCASYFDPDDYDVDLEKLLRQPVEPPQKLLEKYTWAHAAQQWFALIQHFA
jgi:glycosyltransferase involved in cell wall biosynthesis